MYPFGFGLSYTTFKYSNLQLPSSASADKDLKVSVDVTNTGDRDGEEVIELYVKDEKASTPRPICQLEGFERINLKKAKQKRLVLPLSQDNYL